MQVKTDWLLVPFVRIGPIDLGSTRAELRNQFAATIKQVVKGSGRWAQDIDILSDLSVQLFYDNQSLIEQVQVYFPLDLVYDGIHFVGRPIRDLGVELSRIGHGLILDPNDSANVDCPTLGLALYVQGGIVEAVTVNARSAVATP